ncbi:hypothetical protein Tco_0815156, partial [Tanacetum coccineum]
RQDKEVTVLLLLLTASKYGGGEGPKPYRRADGVTAITQRRQSEGELGSERLFEKSEDEEIEEEEEEIEVESEEEEEADEIPNHRKRRPFEYNNTMQYRVMKKQLVPRRDPKNPRKDFMQADYVRSKDDKKRGVDYVMKNMFGFYKECLELGPEYKVNKDDISSMTDDGAT